MKTDLLTSLRKYKVTDKQDPIENFITEAFAWLLKNYDDFSFFFIKEILEKLNSDLVVSEKPNWSTQKNFNGFFPDMVCEFNNNSLVFEHKAWTSLHENQLNNYKKHSNRIYNTSYIILITADKKQHEQNPDLAFCWYDIYKIIDRWLDNKENESLFMFKSFQNLLVNEGLGPAAPISHNSILSYYSARSFTNNTLELIKRVFNNKQDFFHSIFITEKDYKIVNKGKEWGRIGLSLLKNWSPAIFVGFLVDGEDHATLPILGKRSPDFSIILSFDLNKYPEYYKNNNYINLLNYLQEEVEKLDDNWNFYNHINDETVNKKNYWHPIHIRKPMIDLFKGTVTAEEQENKFIEAVNTILPIIIQSEYFKNLKNDMKEIVKYNNG